MLRITSLIVACLFLIQPVQARHVKSYVAADGCNVLWPCESVTSSPREEKIAAQLGFGAAVKRYTPTIVAHPHGCPRSAFCGCGAAVRVFGRPVRDLWLAANWYRFPRSQPAEGMVAVRRHHVFVLERHIGGQNWLAYDANSGHHATRIHSRSIAGYTIVNPHGG